MLSKPYDAALVVGRLQHIHKGHEHLIKSALSIADRVVVLLGSSQESGTVKNPFTITTRADLLRAVFPDEDQVRIGQIADLDIGDSKPMSEDWVIHLLEQCKVYIRKAPDVVVKGSESDALNWFKISPGIKQLTRNMSELTVSRTTVDISATQMRTYLLEDDFALWEPFAPSKIHKYYERLRGELTNAPGYAELVRKQHRAIHPLKSWTDKPEPLKT